MRITVDEEVGTITVDGITMSANVLKRIADPNTRVLWRFNKQDGIIRATAYTEFQVIWIDRKAEEDDQSTDCGVVNDSV